jgi:hypothetical protein
MARGVVGAVFVWSQWRLLLVGWLVGGGEESEKRDPDSYMNPEDDVSHLYFFFFFFKYLYLFILFYKFYRIFINQDYENC